MKSWPGRLRAGFVVLVFAFLAAPILTVIGASFGAPAGLTFPPTAFTLAWYRSISPEYLSALRVSVLVAGGTTAIATLVGTPAALALVRGGFQLRRLLSAICLLPLTVSTLVIAIAAFQFNVVLWSWFGVSLTGTIPGLILTESAFTLPFVIRAVIAGQAYFDPAMEEAAANLGANPVQSFLRVTLPILLPGIISGALFAFLMSFDDIAVTLFIGGGQAMTLPLRIYTAIEFNFDTDVLPVSSLIVIASLVIMLMLDRLVGAERFSSATRA